MYVTLQITGEFAGRSRSNAGVDWTGRICKPCDYDDLRAVVLIAPPSTLFVSGAIWFRKI